MILQKGQIYEVMVQHARYNHRLRQAQSDEIDGQEVLVLTRDIEGRPSQTIPIHRAGITGRIVPDSEKHLGWRQCFPWDKNEPTAITELK